MRLRERYKINKETKVNSECVCPSCNYKFIKLRKNQVFCTTKQGTKCKDFYYNSITPSKRNNTVRISPANQAYYNNIIPLKKEFIDDGLDYLLDCGDR